MPTTVDALSAGIINRSIPGGETLTSGNANLRQPSGDELRAREHVFDDITSIRRGTVISQPVKSRKDIQALEKRLSDLRARMKREGAKASLMTEYANAISPLFVYERDLSIQQRMAALRRGRSIAVYPGEEIRFRYHGSCTDHNLPAPGANEPVSLVSQDALFPSDLHNVVNDVVRYGATHPQYPTQAVIWFIRGLGGEVDLSNAQNMQKSIDEAHPGDWDILTRWSTDQTNKARRKELFRSLASVVLTRTGLGQQANSLLGSAQGLVTAFQNASPAQLASMVNADMSAIRSMPINATKPNDLSALSQYHGFDVVAQANSLQIDGILYNATTRPLTFDPTETMVAQAERPTQRSIGDPTEVGFPGYMPIDPSLQGDVSRGIKDGLNGLRDTPAYHGITDLLNTANDACSMVGIGEAVHGVTTPGRGLNFADAAFGVLNVFKVAATGTQLDGSSASAAQRLLDVALATGGVAAAIAAAPELAAAAGIGSTMAFTEALGVSLEAGAVEALDAAPVVEAADFGTGCDAVGMLHAGQSIVNWGAGEPQGADSWIGIGNALNKVFGLFR
jgi:hypothetical protein